MVRASISLEEQSMIDYRTSNPGLHVIRVREAMKILEHVREFMDALRDFCHMDGLAIATVMISEAGKLILNDTAWMEAAARLFADMPAPDAENAANE
jgi:hypothetical protein